MSYGQHAQVVRTAPAMGELRTLILTLKSRMYPEKLLALVPYPDQPAETGILLLQQRVELAQVRSLRPDFPAVCHIERLLSEQVLGLLHSFTHRFDGLLRQIQFLFDALVYGVVQRQFYSGRSHGEYKAECTGENLEKCSRTTQESDRGGRPGRVARSGWCYPIGLDQAVRRRGKRGRIVPSNAGRPGGV